MLIIIAILLAIIASALLFGAHITLLVIGGFIAAAVLCFLFYTLNEQDKRTPERRAYEENKRAR